MARQSHDSIEALSEVLRSLRITKEYVLEENRTTELVTLEMEKMSTALVPAVYNRMEQAVMPKIMVSDLEWFDRDQTKFEN